MVFVEVKQNGFTELGGENIKFQFNVTITCHWFSKQCIYFLKYDFLCIIWLMGFTKKFKKDTFSKYSGLKQWNIYKFFWREHWGEKFIKRDGHKYCPVAFSTLKAHMWA